MEETQEEMRDPSAMLGGGGPTPADLENTVEEEVSTEIKPGLIGTQVAVTSRESPVPSAACGISVVDTDGRADYVWGFSIARNTREEAAEEIQELHNFISDLQDARDQLIEYLEANEDLFREPGDEE